MNSRTIEHVKQLKLSVMQRNFESSQDIANNIDNIINSFWEVEKPLRNEDLFEQDLSQLCLFHHNLISEVIKIHSLEHSIKNSKVLSSNNNFKSCIDQIENSKSAHKIYMFNEEAEYFFVGDLHSDDKSLKRALQAIDFYNKAYSNHNFRVIFVGDYVDRGHVHLKLLERLLIVKVLFPEHIFLLRGNHDGGILHDDGSLTLPYREPEQDAYIMYFPTYLKLLTEKNISFDPQLLKAYLELFNSLSYIAVLRTVKGIVYGVHGGLPRPSKKSDFYFDYIKNLSDLTNEAIVDNLGYSIVQSIMWSDPYRGDGDLRDDYKRFRFTDCHFDAFKNRFGVDLLIRGHETADYGFRHHFNDGVITIFSSGALHVFKGNQFTHVSFNPESAYEDITPKVLVVDLKGEISFV